MDAESSLKTSCSEPGCDATVVPNDANRCLGCLKYFCPKHLKETTDVYVYDGFVCGGCEKNGKSNPPSNLYIM